MRRVVITGANRGLGLALARLHAARGDQVFASCRDPENASDLHALAAHDGARLHLLQLDVMKSVEATAACVEVASLVDGVDLLYNNAGIHVRDCDPFDPEALSQVLQVNAVGAARVANAFADLMARGTSPMMLNVSSQLGSLIKADSGWGTPIYNTSKAALNMLSRMYANTWHASGVTVLAVHPGWVRTDMGGSEAPVEAEDAAKGLLALTETRSLTDTGRFFTYEGDEHPW